MRHLCLKCGKDEYTFEDNTVSNMIQCQACLRWFHLKCSKPHVHNLEEDFQCYVCNYFLEESSKLGANSSRQADLGEISTPR